MIVLTLIIVTLLVLLVVDHIITKALHKQSLQVEDDIRLMEQLVLEFDNHIIFFVNQLNNKMSPRLRDHVIESINRATIHRSNAIATLRNFKNEPPRRGYVYDSNKNKL